MYYYDSHSTRRLKEGNSLRAVERHLYLRQIKTFLLSRIFPWLTGSISVR